MNQSKTQLGQDLSSKVPGKQPSLKNSLTEQTACFRQPCVVC